MNSYFVCITISRRTIAFEYHQDGASKPLSLFPGEVVWPAPMAFYCDSNEIAIGLKAEKAANNRVHGAFKEWFKVLSSTETVNYHGQQQPVNSLLLLAAEEQLRKFLSQVRYNRDGGLESCRATMPLVLSFEDDVEDPMRIHIINLFQQMGYGRILQLFHNRFIAAHYFNVVPSRDILIADSDGVDMTISLFGKGREKETDKCVLAGFGSDPRLKRVCEMIWTKTGAEFSFLNRERENAHLEEMASKILAANRSEYEDVMHYSNGESYPFLISRNELHQLSSQQTVYLREQIKSFLSKNQLPGTHDVTLVLRNFAAKSDYFKSVLSNEFPNLHVLTKESNNSANAIVLDKVSQWLNSEQSAIPPEPKTIDVAPTVDNDWPVGAFEIPEPSSETVFGESRKQKGDLPKITIDAPDTPAVDPKAIKGLEREWREQRAISKGKVSTGKNIEARAILTDFRKKVSAVVGTQDLLSKIDAEIAALPAETPPPAPKPHNPVKSKTVTPPNRPSKPEPKAPPKLIPQTQLKDARDKARVEGNMGKAKILSDIIRAERSISIRKNSLEECRHNKDKTQIERIIKELDDYINLCQKGGVDAEEYAKLKLDYKKILK